MFPELGLSQSIDSKNKEDESKTVPALRSSWPGQEGDTGQINEKKMC
jgi:hypothetical protein